MSCTPLSVSTACPVCAVNMSECAGKAPEVEPEPEPEQPRIQIGVPAKDLTVANVTNLIYI